MSDGFEHPVHIPKRDDQPDRKKIGESKVGYSDILGWSSGIAGVCIAIVFVWNFLVDNWLLIRLLLILSGIGGALYVLFAKNSLGISFLPYSLLPYIVFALSLYPGRELINKVVPHTFEEDPFSHFILWAGFIALCQFPFFEGGAVKKIFKTIGAYIALYCFVFFILFDDEKLTKAAKASCQHAQEPIKDYACDLVTVHEAIKDMPTKEEMEALEKEIQREIEKHKALKRNLERKYGG